MSPQILLDGRKKVPTKETHKKKLAQVEDKEIQEVAKQLDNLSLDNGSEEKTTDVVEEFSIPIPISFYQSNSKKMDTVFIMTEWANKKRLKLLIEDPFTDSSTRKQLKSYLSNKVGENRFQVEYVYSGKSHHEGGRLFARNNAGLQMFPKDIRAFIAGEYYDNIDTVNAMPTILADAFEMLGMKVPKYLHDLVHNRDEFLKTTKKTKKQVLEALMTTYKSPNDPKLKSIHTKIYKVLVNKWRLDKGYEAALREHIEKSRVPEIKGTRKGSFVALVTQTYDNQVLKSLIEFFKKDDVALVFDGMLVAKDPLRPTNQQLLDDLAVHVKATTGFSLKFVKKPMIISD
ncbi:hypothetical protein HKX48_009508, partial [Thoreauomyces humboldtii]